VLNEDRVGTAWSSVAVLVTFSALMLGKGGGNGEIEIEVTLAECA
jgi:hypothetical protein